MLIGRKRLIIHKNISQIENDFSKLTENSENQYTDNQIKLFIGTIINNSFKFVDTTRLRLRILIKQELIGIMIEKDRNTTEILIEIHLKFPNLDTIFGFFILSLMFLFGIMHSIKYSSNIGLIILVPLFLSLPIYVGGSCIYNIRKMLNDIQYYIAGLYNKYLL